MQFVVFDAMMARQLKVQLQCVQKISSVICPHSDQTKFHLPSFSVGSRNLSSSRDFKNSPLTEHAASTD